MPDIVHKVSKFVDHNRYFFSALVLASVPFFLIGCSYLEARMDSQITGARSTADQVESNAIAMISEQMRIISTAQSEIAKIREIAGHEIATLDAQTERNYEIVTTIARTFTENPAVAGFLGSVGLGAVVANVGLLLDNRRKDRVIKKQSESA